MTLPRPTGARTVTLEECFTAASFATGVSHECLFQRRRDRKIARARQLAWWLARRFTGLSFPQIGAFSGRDHSTVQHGCAKFEAEAAKDLALQRQRIVAVDVLYGRSDTVAMGPSGIATLWLDGLSPAVRRMLGPRDALALPMPCSDHEEAKRVVEEWLAGLGEATRDALSYHDVRALEDALVPRC